VTPIIKILDQRVSSALKTMPTVLGRTLATGSSGQVEAVIYTKFVKFYQKFVADTLSKMFTLALRLNGSPSHVQFYFDFVSLRADQELETMYIQKQKRLIEAVKLGWLEPDEAAFQLYHDLPVDPSKMAKIHGQYIELDTKLGLSGDRMGNGGTPMNTDAEEDPKGTTRDTEDIVGEGQEPSPTQTQEENE
jgi:hypothetical protein